jgi:hypothetical protein
MNRELPAKRRSLAPLLVLGFLPVAVASIFLFGGLRVERKACGHLVTTWFGLAAEHDCPYLAPAELLTEVAALQDAYKDKEGRYAGSPDEFVRRGWMDSRLPEKAARSGFLTRIAVSGDFWEAVSGAPQHERVVYVSKRKKVTTVEKRLLVERLRRLLSESAPPPPPGDRTPQKR